MEQVDLDIDWGEVPKDLAEGFRVFHRDNPAVYDRLVSMATSMARRGRTRIGMKMLFEVLRWEYFMETKSNEPFKLNNNYTAFYSRLIEHNNPHLRGLFTKRQSVSDRAVA